MSLFRDEMRNARQELHDYMKFPAFYYSPGSSTAFEVVHVRLHDKFLLQGDLKGTNFHFAEVREDSPRLIFMRAEKVPERNAVVVIDRRNAFRIDNLDPEDDITVKAFVVRLRENAFSHLRSPEDGITGFSNIAVSSLG